MNKKIPQRRCMGCMTSFDKNTLLRIVRTASGKVVFDEKGKTEGRGAYVCKNDVCLKKAVKAGRFSRALKVSVEDSVISTLEEAVNRGR